MSTPIERQNLTNIGNRQRVINNLNAKIAKLQRDLINETAALTTANAEAAKPAHEQACGHVQWYDSTLADMLNNNPPSFLHNCYIERGIGDNPAILFRGTPENIGVLVHNLDIHQLTYTRGVNFVRDIKPHRTQAVIVTAETIFVVTP